MTVAVVPSSSTPVHAKQPINVTVTGAASNTATGYNASNYPASPELRYYFSIEKSGSDALVSEVFSVGSAGTHTWPSVIIPAAGVWTAHLRKDSDDSSAANATITASQPMGGGVLGQDTLGNFILGTISTGEAAPHDGSISATLSIPTISAALTVGTISAAITINTISAVVTINEESG